MGVIGSGSGDFSYSSEPLSTIEAGTANGELDCHGAGTSHGSRLPFEPGSVISKENWPGTGLGNGRPHFRRYQARGVLPLFRRCSDLPLRSGWPLAAGVRRGNPLPEGARRRDSRHRSGTRGPQPRPPHRRRLGWAKRPTDLDSRIRSVALELLADLGAGRLRFRQPPTGKAQPIGRDELDDVLERISRWDNAAWFAHRERYVGTYGPSTLLAARLPER